MSKLFLLEDSDESQVEPAVQSNELDTRNIVTLQVSFIFSILDSTFKLKDILIKDPMGSKLAKENLFKFINVKNKLKDINSFTVMQLGPVQYKTMLLKKNVELVIEAEVDYCTDGEDSKLKLGGKVEDLRPLNVYYRETGNNKNMKEYYKQKTNSSLIPYDEFFERYDKNAQVYLDKSIPENFRHRHNLKESNEINFSEEVLNKELEVALYPVLDKWADYMELNQWLSIIKDTIIKYDRTH